MLTILWNLIIRLQRIILKKNEVEIDIKAIKEELYQKSLEQS